MNKTAITVLIMLMLSLLITGVYAAPGAADDPIVTKSYVDALASDILDYAKTQIDENLAGSYGDFENITPPKEAVTAESAASAIAAQIEQQMVSYAPPGTELILAKGQTLLGGNGAIINVLSGAANMYTGTLIDFTSGRALPGFSQLPQSKLICFLDGAGVRSITDTNVLVTGYYRILPAPKVKYADMAEALNELNLFEGTGAGYDLERPPTRIELLIMLIKLLGENNDALNFTGSHPFTDVPQWACPYVAYGYYKGYTAGTSASTFAPLQLATVEQYTTFILKALGYTAGKDFDWNESPEFARKMGILTDTEAMAFSLKFDRDEMVYQSWCALLAQSKNTGLRLLEALILSGHITADQAQESISKIAHIRN